MELVIIGTSPPCPRCDRTLMMAEEIIRKSGADCSVRQIDYKTEEAEQVALLSGRKIGTTREVSEASGVMVDRKAFADAVLTASEGKDDNCRPAELWSPAFDKALENVVRAADKVNYYVTPVLVRDGKVLWHGSVPDEDDLRNWIMAHK